MSSDSLNDLLVRLTETDRQERKWLADEILELKTIICALLLSNGPLTISDRAMAAVSRDSAFNLYYDVENRCCKLELV